MKYIKKIVFSPETTLKLIKRAIRAPSYPLFKDIYEKMRNSSMWIYITRENETRPFIVHVSMLYGSSKKTFLIEKDFTPVLDWIYKEHKDDLDQDIQEQCV